MSVKQSIVDTVFETPLVDVSALIPARERRARVLSAGVLQSAQQREGPHRARDD